jgi:hypothetical protein
MGDVINRVERHVITKQGEVEITINLNLTITLDSQGGLQVATTIDKTDALEKKVKEKIDKIIPEFAQVDIIDFGKNA